jgi:hypothetical protein
MKTDTDTVFASRLDTINGLYTTAFASRLDSSRFANKLIIHHCLLRADWIPVALKINGLNTFCKEVGNIHFL